MRACGRGTAAASPSQTPSDLTSTADTSSLWEKGSCRQCSWVIVPLGHCTPASMASAVGAAGGSSSGGGGMPGGLSAKQQKLFELRMRMV